MGTISYVSIVWFIAVGALCFFLFLLFAKRQITRFTLRSSRQPHAQIGADGPAPLKEEIFKRLRRVADIKVEPKLMSHNYNEEFQNSSRGREGNHYILRMKAIDSLALLDQEIRFYDIRLLRRPGQNLRQYLTGLMTGPLSTIRAVILHDFTDLYEQARHDPAEFGPREFDRYMDLLDEIVECVKHQLHSRRQSLASGNSATSQTALITSNLSHPTILEVKYRRHRGEDTESLVTRSLSEESV